MSCRVGEIHDFVDARILKALIGNIVAFVSVGPVEALCLNGELDRVGNVGVRIVALKSE